MASSAAAQEPWKESGLTRGPGIPAPSGQYRVGCVDLMHQMPGDEKGLLVRLYYPTGATHQDGYIYPLWIPRRRYIKGTMIADGVKLPGLMSLITNSLMSKFTKSFL